MFCQDYYVYGLEVLPFKTTHINKLEDFHRKTIRFLQSLPQRTSIAAIYLLLGALPLQAEYHKKQLSLLYSLLACENNKIHEIIIRQISVNNDNKNSFFTNIKDVLYMHEVPTISELQHKLPTKLVWKQEIKKQIHNHWTKRLIDEAGTKSSLKFLDINNLKIGKTHNIWNLEEKSRLSVKKSVIKARIITGTFILQIDKHKFTQYSSSIPATCLLCHKEDEDIIHFLTSCPMLVNVREEPFLNLKEEVIKNTAHGTWHRIFNTKYEISKLIIDCKNFKDIYMEDERILHRI
jgi:hypothetical protein